MSPTPNPADVALLPIRRAQVAAAVKVLSLDGFTFEPFFAAFGSELTQSIALSSPGGFAALRVTTQATGADACQRWRRLLGDEVYQAPAGTVRLAGELCAFFGDQGLELAVEEEKDAAEPRLILGFTGRWPRSKVWELLEKIGVGEGPRTEYSRLVGKLRVDEVVRFALVLDRPESPPRFEVSFPWLVPAADRDTYRGQLDLASTALGISDKQRAWAGGVYEALTPRPINETLVTVSMTSDLLVPELRLRFTNIPGSTALLLLTQLAPRPDNPTLLGALTAAAGMQPEFVSALEVVTWSKEPARVAVELKPTAPTASATP